MKTTKIDTRGWNIIRKMDSFTTEEFMTAMGISQKEALEILQIIHDQDYLTLKWVEQKGKLCYVKTKPVNDDIN